MRKPLASGTLWWLLNEMPPTLKLRLNEELKQLDKRRRATHKKGDTRITSMELHLRWMYEDQADLAEMKHGLFDVLERYLPLKKEHMRNNELPKLSDCTYFWGREIAHIEKESTKAPIPV